MEIKRYLVIPDLHYPYHDPSFLALIPRIVKLAKIYGIVQLGDALDFWQISRYDKNPARKRTIAEDAALYKTTLIEWAKCLPKDGVIHQIEGNHCDRLRRYVWANAKELEGLVKTVPEMIGLRDLPIKAIWHPIHKWDSCKIGDAILHHGHFFNQHLAVGNLTRYPKKFIQGHSHRFQFASNGTHFSASLGHGSNESETAHQPTPTGWQQAMGILVVINGVSHLEPILVKNGRCVVYGQEVSSKT